MQTGQKKVIKNKPVAMKEEENQSLGTKALHMVVDTTPNISVIPLQNGLIVFQLKDKDCQMDFHKLS